MLLETLDYQGRGIKKAPLKDNSQLRLGVLRLMPPKLHSFRPATG
ncbi:hypothetical protein GPB2148_911 [marine gamma proteobacterium HTCC2148]|nr:hypothetical protein GPB2148_911 [marine gamma proteobacterium HTCC2148]